MKTPRKKVAPPRVTPPILSPVSETILVAPPAPVTLVPASSRNPVKEGGKKRPMAKREHPGARDTAGKASRSEIRRETSRRFPSRLTPQQAKRKGSAPGSRAAKPKRA